MQGNERTEKIERIPIREYLESLHENVLQGLDASEEEEICLQEEEHEAPVCQLLAEYIRGQSREAKLVCCQAIKEILSVTQEEADAAVLALREENSFPDIYVIEGKKDKYYYAYPIMAHSFAQIAADILDKDIAGGIERVVRNNQFRFNMPTPVSKFQMYPYYYTKIQIQNAVRKILREKHDIEEYVTGNKKSYLYVSSVLSHAMAHALAEDCETDEWGEYRN